MMKRLALSLLLVAPVFGAEARQRFPLIEPVARTFDFADAQHAGLSLPIRTATGKPAYRLECRGLENREPDFDNYNFNYSGDFECRLAPEPNPDFEITLLTDNPRIEREWQSRGRFFSKSLRGACAAIPDFGTRRSFQLRGMKIVLDVQNPIFDAAGELKSLKVGISVERDPTAWRSIAAVVPYPKHYPSECEISRLFYYPGGDPP